MPGQEMKCSAIAVYLVLAAFDRRDKAGERFDHLGPLIGLQPCGVFKIDRSWIDLDLPLGAMVSSWAPYRRRKQWRGSGIFPLAQDIGGQ